MSQISEVLKDLIGHTLVDIKADRNETFLTGDGEVELTFSNGKKAVFTFSQEVEWSEVTKESAYLKVELK